MKSFRHKLVLAVSLLIFLPYLSQAQCAMCRAVLETGDNQNTAAAINHGITFLMIFPYLLVGIVGFAIYRIIKKAKAN